MVNKVRQNAVETMLPPSFVIVRCTSYYFPTRIWDASHLKSRSQRSQYRSWVGEQHPLQGGDHGNDHANNDSDDIGRHQKAHDPLVKPSPVALPISSTTLIVVRSTRCLVAGLSRAWLNVNCSFVRADSFDTTASLLFPLRQCVTRSSVRRRLTAYCRQNTRLDQLPGELVFESIVMSKGEEPPPKKVDLQHT